MNLAKDDKVSDIQLEQDLIQVENNLNRLKYALTDPYCYAFEFF